MMQIRVQSKSKTGSDEMAHYELSHLDLHCLHRYWFWSARLKELTLLLLNTTCLVLANSVDPDQLASEEAN